MRKTFPPARGVTFLRRAASGAKLTAMRNDLPHSEPTRSAPLSRDHIVVLDVVSRPPEERPAHDSIDEIAEWLVGPARQIDSGTASFDEFAWRLLAAGVPLLRVTLHVGTIHPQFLGS